MKKYENEIVAHIYETRDYARFKFLKENRGRTESLGLSRKRLEHLQWLVNNNKWVPEEQQVKVNKDFVIVQGRHNFEISLRNNLPVRWTFINDHRFNNGTSRRELIANVFSINTVDTSWGKPEVFNGAVAAKFPLAILIKRMVDRYENQFKWTDVIALLTQEEDYFSHAAYSKYIDMKETFENRDFIKQIEHATFRAEITFLLELMELFTGSHEKRMMLRSVYSIINKAKELVDVKAFRKCVLKIDKDKLERFRAKKLQHCIKFLIDHYNRSVGDTVEHTAVSYQIKVSTNRRTRAKQQLLQEAA